MSEQNICPVCDQKRDKLVSLDSITERIHGMTIDKDGIYIDKICYPCRAKAEKKLKKDVNSRLSRDNFTIIFSGYLKYLDKLKRNLKLPKDLIDQPIKFIDQEFLKFKKHIDSNDKMKYHFASIIMLLQDKQMVEKEELMRDYIIKHHTNVSMNGINEAINEIKNFINNFPIKKTFRKI